MIISERQVLLLIEIACIASNATNISDGSIRIIKELVKEIYDQQSNELKEITGEARK